VFALGEKVMVVWRWKSNDTSDEPPNQLSRQHWEEFGLWSSVRDYKLRPGTSPSPSPIPGHPSSQTHIPTAFSLLTRTHVHQVLPTLSHNRNHRIPLLRLPPHRRSKIPRPSLAGLPIDHRGDPLPARIFLHPGRHDSGGVVPE